MVSPQHSHSLRIQGDRPPATGALGLGELYLLAHFDQCLVDGDSGMLEIDVVPLQPQGLPSPSAGHGEEVPEAVEPLLLHTLKEGEELLCRPSR